jgi:hypothetical protein
MHCVPTGFFFARPLLNTGVFFSPRFVILCAPLFVVYNQVAVNWYFTPFKQRWLARLRDAFERHLPMPRTLTGGTPAQVDFMLWASVQRALAAHVAGESTAPAGVASGGRAGRWAGKAAAVARALAVEAAVGAVTAAAHWDEAHPGSALATALMQFAVTQGGDTSAVFRQ